MKDWNKMYQSIIGILQNELPAHLTYHKWQHTEYVINMAESIAKYENINNEDLLLIKTAALFHDLGFIFSDKTHEEESILYAKNVLPSFGYNDEEINIISGLIRATIIPQNPKNNLEKILADADLEYLGTDDFKEIGDSLYLELKFKNPAFTIEQWNEIQINFLKSHHYHTNFCIENRKKKKYENLMNLIIESKTKDTTIIHLTICDYWNTQKENEFYFPENFESEGFIHASTHDQVNASANRYYKNETILCALFIDCTKLKSELKFEFSTSVNDDFPHIYGGINKDAILKVEKLEKQVEDDWTIV